MKKKGFTLIELLAVIVILAVIALIATPAVLNVIEDSKKAAAEASARNIVSSAKTYYMQKIMDGETISDIDLSGSTLTYDGDKATKGTISYDTNGNTYGKMYISGYCIEVKSDGSVSSDKVSESECDISLVPGEDTGKKSYSGVVTLNDPDNIHYSIYDGEDANGTNICTAKLGGTTCNVKVTSGYMYSSVSAKFTLSVESSKGVSITRVSKYTILVEVLENNFELNLQATSATA